MAKLINFIIVGEPMGKGRPRFSTRNGYVRTHTPKETMNYETKVVFSYKERNKGMAFEPNEMIRAKIVAYFLIPKGHYRFHKKTNTTDLDTKGQAMLEGKILPTKKPDCDNIAKIILDALNGIAYHDDSQVVELTVEKRYSENARVYVELWGE